MKHNSKQFHTADHSKRHRYKLLPQYFQILTRLTDPIESVFKRD
jgi:hypothetical protein